MQLGGYKTIIFMIASLILAIILSIGLIIALIETDTLSFGDEKNSNSDENTPPESNPITNDQSIANVEIGDSKCLNKISYKDNVVRFINIKADDTLTSPFTLKISLPGSWCFEANCPVKIVSDKNIPIYSGGLIVEGDWMTTEKVTAKGSLTFNPGSYKSGYLLIQTDNPAGNPESCSEVKLPVQF